MKFCFGLIIFLACPDERPVPVSEFCVLAATEITALRNLSQAELAALSRPRKEAIRNLRQLHRRLCPAGRLGAMR
jgi:hypothetical protein